MTYGKVIKVVLILTLSVLTIFPATGCGGKYSAKVTPEPTAEITTEEGGKSTVATSAGCVEVSPEKLAEIEAKLNIAGGGSLKDGRAVKSDDFDNLYFLAAEVEGPAFYGNGQYAIWAVDSLEPGGEIISVNSNAKVFSDWPKADASITKDNDGYAESQTCVEAFQKGL